MICRTGGSGRQLEVSAAVHLKSDAYLTFIPTSPQQQMRFITRKRIISGSYLSVACYSYSLSLTHTPFSLGICHAYKLIMGPNEAVFIACPDFIFKCISTVLTGNNNGKRP